MSGFTSFRSSSIFTTPSCPFEVMEDGLYARGAADKHRWDAAVRLTSSEETGNKAKKNDIFIFELANDDVERKEQTRYRSGVVTHGGPHSAQTLDVPVPTIVLSTIP